MGTTNQTFTKRKKGRRKDRIIEKKISGSHPRVPALSLVRFPWMVSAGLHPVPLCFATYKPVLARVHFVIL